MLLELFPALLGDIQSLVDLWLYNNDLVGDVPRQLCRLLSV
jgi:hypothetical protein